MRKWLTVALVTLLSLVHYSSTAAAAGLDRSPHDFSVLSLDQNRCAVCHPPHATATQSGFSFNRNPSTITFRWRDATETSGRTRLPITMGAWSGSSRVCLGCHDGTIDTRSFGSGRSIGPAGGFRCDLTGNHPIGIPYPYNGTKNTYNGITTGDAAMKSAWVATPRDVKLFQDPNGPALNNYGIECASCHDPHGASHPRFLRVSMARDQLCERCHRK